MTPASSPTAKPWAVTAAKVAEVVSRLSADAAPSRLIVCGSAARGDLSAAKDLDLMVIEREPVNRYAETLRLRSLLRDVLMPIDLVVTTEASFHERSKIPGTLDYHVAQDGLFLHDAR